MELSVQQEEEEELMEADRVFHDNCQTLLMVTRTVGAAGMHPSKMDMARRLLQQGGADPNYMCVQKGGRGTSTSSSRPVPQPPKTQPWPVVPKPTHLSPLNQQEP
jgi:hypothetical protein